MFTNADRHIIISTPNGNGVWQIYFNTGAGYTELESVKFTVINGRGYALAPAKAFRFRLDPPDGCLHATITEMRMSDGEETISPQPLGFHNIKPAKPLDDRAIVLEIPQKADDPNVTFAIQVPDAGRLFGFIPADYKKTVSILLFFIALVSFMLVLDKPNSPVNWRDWRRLTGKKSFWLLLAAGLLFARTYDRVHYAVLWAEDGIYLKEALDHGVSSLFMPYGGYFNTVPRILGFLASLLPVTWMPYFITISALVVAFGVFSEILLSRYEWLLPDIRQRGLLMLAMILCPGTNEIIGAVCGLYLILYLYVALLGISSPDRRFGRLDLAVILLAILSTGAVLTLLPLYLARLGWHALKKSGRGFLAQEGFVVFGILAISVVNFFLRTSLSTTSFDPLVMAHLYWKSVLCEMVSYPVVAFLPYLVKFPAWIFTTAPLAVYLVMNNIKMPSKNKKIFIAFIFSMTLMPAMTSMARADSVDVFLYHFRNYAFWTSMRYSFIMSVAGYMLWFVTFSSSGKHGASGITFTLALFLMAFVFIMAEGRFFTKIGSGNNEWVNHAAEIALTRKDPTYPAVKVLIAPNGWSVEMAPNPETKSEGNPDPAD